MTTINVISIVVLSILAFVYVIEARTSADLTDAEIDKIKEKFEIIQKMGRFTCSNYQERCGTSASKTLCELFAKRFLCNGLNDREGVRLIVRELEKNNPDFVDQWTQAQ